MMLSVIIPVYNAASTIERCVGSIIGSAGPVDYEIILVDDGSKDESLEICSRIADCHPEVKVLHQDNAGAAAARNRGIAVAKGNYLAFVDSDDYVTPDFVTVIAKTVFGESFDILWFNIQYVDEDGKQLFKTDLEDAELSKRDFLSCFFGMNTSVGSMCSKVYRRAFIEEAQVTIDEKRVYGEDWDYNLRLGLASPRVRTISATLYNYVKYASVSTVTTRYYKADFDVYTECHLRLKKIASDNCLSYDIDENNELYAYNVLSLLVKLGRSELSESEKVSEYKRIVSDKAFHDALIHTCPSNRFMSKRQQFASLLLRFNLDSFAKQVLGI